MVAENDDIMRRDFSAWMEKKTENEKKDFILYKLGAFSKETGDIILNETLLQLLDGGETNE